MWHAVGGGKAEVLQVLLEAGDCCNQTWQAGEMPIDSIDVSSSCNGKIWEIVDRTIQISADPFALEHRFLFVWASLLDSGTPQVLLRKPVVFPPMRWHVST